jgi:WD40-like Beta Propeller Repeat
VASPHERPGGHQLNGHLAFRDAGQLKATEVATGATRVIADVTSAGIFGGAWSSDGTILVGSATGVLRVNATGGAPSPLALADGAGPKTARAVSQFLPDGVHFLYAVPKTETPNPGLTVYVGDLRTGDARALLDANSWAQAASGYLLFVRAGTLYAQTFNAGSMELSGEAIAIEQVIPGLPTFSVSQTGILGIRPAEGRPPSDLVWIDRNGAEQGTLKKPPTGDYGNPAVSPDGTRVAVNSVDSRSGRSDIWIIDTARDVAERFTLGDGPSADPLWSLDGRQIAFVSERNGRLYIVAKAIDGSGEQVLEDCGPGTLSFSGALRVVLSDWSADGKLIAYSFGQGGGLRSIRVLSVADRRSHDLPLQSVSPYSMRFSRDGKWIAYAASDSGQMEVFIRAYPALNQLHQVSNGGGRHPRWGKNDREIFYSNRVVNVVSLTEEGTDLRPGVSRAVYDRDLREPLDNRHHYTITADAQRLLVRRPIGGGALSSVHVLVNWPAMLPQ